MPDQRALIVCLLACTSILPQARGQLCGDCNGDSVVTIVDALVASQHTVLLLTLTSPDFDACNVFGDPGGPIAPGNPVVNVLDSLAIAQHLVGLRPTLACTASAYVWAGPFDLVLQTPIETASDARFEATVSIYRQGTAEAVIPAAPLLVTIQMNTGPGTIRGSPRQWMRTHSMAFSNLHHAELGTYTVRATAGAPHGDAVSPSITNVVAVESDLHGSVQIAPGPYVPVRFNLRAAGLSTPRPGDSFEWEVVDVSSSVILASGTLPLAGQTFVDVPVLGIPGVGLYRVTASIAGSVARDDHALHVGVTSAEHVLTLPSGRIGVPYSESIAAHSGGAFSDVVALAAEIPPGLTLAPGPAGDLTGTPVTPGMHRITFFGITAGFDVTRVAAHVAIFSERDTEIESGVSFASAGPHATSEIDFPTSGSVSFPNPWSCAMDSTRMRIYYPTNIQNLRRLPVICFIHGNGFAYDSYDEIMRVVASYGYIVGSCNNLGYPGGTCMPCGGGAAPSGWGRATGFQLFVHDQILAWDDDPAFVLYQHVDRDNFFWSGHSRGGATSLLNLKLRPEFVRGCIPLMPVDPKRDTCLALSNDFPPVPTLNISGERDQDEAFPASENLMEDATLTGADTHVTIYGGNHNYTTDTFAAEFGSSPTITRAAQHQHVRHWMVAFLERHTRGDLRLEGQLYLSEHTSSTDFAVFGRRGMTGAVVVDDHNVTPDTTNSLGGANTWVTVTASDTNSYPIYMTNGRSITHRRFAFVASPGFNRWSAPPGAPVDASDLTSLAFRARQYNSTSVGGTGTGNWQSWLTSYSVTIADSGGQMATVGLIPAMPVSGTPSPAQQRFHRFVLPLVDFEAINPALDRAALASVRLDIGPSSGSSRLFAIDDVRFE